jgi:hypothetical protein
MLSKILISLYCICSAFNLGYLPINWYGRYHNITDVYKESLNLIWKLKEEFEDTKGVIRIRKSKKDRQHNGQMKKYKRTNNDLQNIHIKIKIE